LWWSGLRIYGSIFKGKSKVKGQKSRGAAVENSRVAAPYRVKIRWIGWAVKAGRVLILSRDNNGAVFGALAQGRLRTSSVRLSPRACAATASALGTWVVLEDFSI
jgi:hypothetical protein